MSTNWLILALVVNVGAVIWGGISMLSGENTDGLTIVSFLIGVVLSFLFGSELVSRLVS